MNPRKATPSRNKTSPLVDVVASGALPRTRILLADDHALVRKGLRALLATIPDFEVVGEAANGREALQRIRALTPDIVLMDISMPELNGLDATAHALRESPDLKVIIVSVHTTEAHVTEALRVGAAGYLSKDADSDELERVIRAVGDGWRCICPSVSRNGSENDPDIDVAASVGKVEALTPRQRQVLQQIAEGGSTREMAARLHLSVKTIETHRAQLMQRLGIFDVAGLTRHALRIGLIDAEC